ncbi:MAG: hypothetical protein U0797_02195 [Gemmataceae bacterium]
MSAVPDRAVPPETPRRKAIILGLGLLAFAGVGYGVFRAVQHVRYNANRLTSL